MTSPPPHTTLHDCQRTSHTLLNFMSAAVAPRSESLSDTELLCVAVRERAVI